MLPLKSGTTVLHVVSTAPPRLSDIRLADALAFVSSCRLHTDVGPKSIRHAHVGDVIGSTLTAFRRRLLIGPASDISYQLSEFIQRVKLRPRTQSEAIYRQTGIRKCYLSSEAPRSVKGKGTPIA